MYYYLSIGTNISPEKNAASIVSMLAEEFGDITTFPFAYTRPQNMATHNVFLNSAAIIQSHLPHKEVKNILNAIEISLGRDRSDPEKSIKDRTADIDILFCTHDYNVKHFAKAQENYVRDVVNQTIAGVDLSKFGLPATQGATAIYFDTRAGHIRIRDNADDGLIDGSEPSLIP